MPSSAKKELQGQSSLKTRLPEQARLCLFIQGAYYFLTGLWPVLHPPSFLALTGPKEEVWLVQMVGLLAASIGTVLLIALIRQTPVPEVIILGLLSGLSFFAIDLVYLLRGRIPFIYAGDALFEIAFSLFWIIYISFGMRGMLARRS